jgi:hypothetical protein
MTLVGTPAFALVGFGSGKALHALDVFKIIEFLQRGEVVEVNARHRSSGGLAHPRQNRLVLWRVTLCE